MGDEKRETRDKKQGLEVVGNTLYVVRNTKPKSRWVFAAAFVLAK